MTEIGNRYGSDLSSFDDDSRFIERDYSIGGGVTMKRTDLVHGFFGKGPKNWDKSDEKIREEVCETLYVNRYVDASDIEVEVRNAVVFLSGWVNSRDEKKEVQDSLEALCGVKEIRNELHLRNRLIDHVL